jgi:sodium transport system permease protein
MRLSVVRLISFKETRDLLRDRRTVTLIFLAPLLLYPLFGLTAFVFLSELAGKPPVVGVINADAAVLPAQAFPAVGGYAVVTPTPELHFPPLFNDAGDRFADGLAKGAEVVHPKLVPLPPDTDPDEAFKAKKAQAILVVPPNFAADLEAGKRPQLKLIEQEGNEISKEALRAASGAVTRWQERAKEVQFRRDGKPADYGKLIAVDDPSKKPKEQRVANEIRDMLVRAFPLMLVMWLMAGSIQPAVDLTAGEKERGTMETLLISPAERGEIVLGKFFAVTFFGFCSVVWNVACLTAAAVILERVIGEPIVNLPGMLGCLVLGVPIAMLFSAVSLALGVFARSTKEGQYYLIPIMLVSLPLAFVSFIPTTELTPTTAVVPITGGMLLQQKLLAVTGEPVAWEYFPLVLGSLAVYVGLALALAWWQFTREGVLFREMGPAKTTGGLFGRKK